MTTGTGLSLASLVLSTFAVAVLVERVTPASLLTPPERPFADTSRGDVRIAAAPYPRTAIGADDVPVRLEHPAKRIVSQYWSADEFLYSVVEPERVVGVSETAYVRAVSNVLPFVDRFHPIVATDPERVLMAAPDLVLTPDSARPDMPALLRQAGLPVYRIYTSFPTLASIEEHLRLVGYLTGEDERAAEAVARFRAAIDRAATRKPAGAPTPRVLGFSGIYSYGSHTLFTDILRTIGAENLAATHGFIGFDQVTDEDIVQWNPEWIVTGANRGEEAAVRASLLAKPAIAATTAGRLGHVVVIDNSIFLPLSPFTSRLVEALAEALYGKGGSS